MKSQISVKPYTRRHWRRSNNTAPEDYKLLGFVEIRPTKIDWTVLCHDCDTDI